MHQHPIDDSTQSSVPALGDRSTQYLAQIARGMEGL
jgi:hypothetical protein